MRSHPGEKRTYVFPEVDGNPRKMGRVDLGCYENPAGNGTMMLLR